MFPTTSPQLPDDCLTTARWMPDDCLTTAWRLPEDWRLAITAEGELETGTETETEDRYRTTRSSRSITDLWAFTFDVLGDNVQGGQKIMVFRWEERNTRWERVPGGKKCVSHQVGQAPSNFTKYAFVMAIFWRNLRKCTQDLNLFIGLVIDIIIINIIWKSMRLK